MLSDNAVKPEELAGYCLAIMGQPFEKADAIIALTGDGYGRIEEAARLYLRKLADTIMVTGADSTLYKVPHLMAGDFTEFLVKAGVCFEDIVIDDIGKTTPGQARSTVAECKKRGWKSIILVASGDHMVRAYLTFLKMFLKERYPIRMLAHASYVPWFAEDNNLAVIPRERWARFVKEEYPRIIRYQKQGDVASWQELEVYLKEQKL
ncbi:MAG: YdcF family protein [Candidatus Yanofskybacteria bacterium]|nr:YdcF family protein [Candidatus Yanofskybacteria bacterium]